MASGYAPALPILVRDRPTLLLGEVGELGAWQQFYTNASSGLALARSDWTAAPGPQVLTSTTPGALANLHFYEYPYFTPDCVYYDPSCTSGSWAAFTVNWWYDRGVGQWKLCYQTGGACDIEWSDVHLNSGWCSGSMTSTKFRYVSAHEIGHVLGLADHGSGNILMNNAWTGCTPNTSAVAPTSTEIGITPGSACSSPRGIKCIYEWYVMYEISLERNE